MYFKHVITFAASVHKNVSHSCCIFNRFIVIEFGYYCICSMRLDCTDSMSRGSFR